MLISARDIKKEFWVEDVVTNVLNGITLDIEKGEFVSIMGPSGSGKSTLMYILSFLDKPTSGQYFFDGEDVSQLNDDQLAEMRNDKVGFVFQSFNLLARTSVLDNVMLPLIYAGVSAEERTRRAKKMLEQVGLSHKLDSTPNRLSGGEKQRVAIARALAPFQKILLLDEPMSGLDPQTSKYLRTELCALLKRLEITSVFVVHDLLGAEEMADRIAIIHKGQIEQLSAPNDIFFSPRTDIVSEFIGMPNILNCDYCNILSIGLVEVVSGDMSIILPYEGSSIKKLAIPPHDIYISDTKPPGPALNRYKGIITEILPVNSTVRVRVAIGSNNMLTELQKSTFDEMNLGVGKEVYVIVKLRRLRYVEP